MQKKKEIKRFIKLAEKKNTFHIVNNAGYSTEEVDLWAEDMAYAIKTLAKNFFNLEKEMERLMREREIHQNVVDKQEKSKQRTRISFGGKYHHIVKRISELESLIVTLEQRINRLEKHSSRVKK